MHSQNDRQSRSAVYLTTKCAREGPGLLLQLGIRACYLDWIAGRQVWAARFGMQVVHETSTIQLIDWFDSFQESPVNVRSGPTEVVSRNVPFAGIVRWDVLDHATLEITTECEATPPR